VICLNCGEELRARRTDFNGEYAGVSVSIEMEGLVCDSCGYKTVPGSKMEEFGRLVADGYRKQKGLLTSGDIRGIREDLGMSQQQFADHLGVGVASIKRWELGKVQEESMDQLMRLRSSIEAATKNLDELVRISSSSQISVEQAYVISQVIAGPVSNRGASALTIEPSRLLGDVTYTTQMTPSVNFRTPGSEVDDEQEVIVDLGAELGDAELIAA